MSYQALQKPVWDFSVLVDISGRMDEFRGHVDECLGASPRALANRSILDVVAPEDRGVFLRHFGQLGGAELPPGFLARMTVLGVESRMFGIQFEPGRNLRSNWMLFTSNTDGFDASTSNGQLPARFQEEERLLNLIEMAAEQESAEIDVTIIGVGALRDQVSRERLGNGRDHELESAIDQAVLDRADMGLAGKSGKGQYSIVHDRGRPPASLEEEIRDAAQRLGVSDSQLALKSVTVRVSPGTSVAELRARFRGAHEQLSDGAAASEIGRQLRKRLALAAIAAASIGLGLGIGTYLSI